MCSSQSGSNLSPLGHAVIGKVGTLGNGKVYHADRRIVFNVVIGRGLASHDVHSTVEPVANTDGSFTTAVSNLFLSPSEKVP